MCFGKGLAGGPALVVGFGGEFVREETMVLSSCGIFHRTWRGIFFSLLSVVGVAADAAVVTSSVLSFVLDDSPPKSPVEGDATETYS